MLTIESTSLRGCFGSPRIEIGNISCFPIPNRCSHLVYTFPWIAIYSGVESTDTRQNSLGTFEFHWKSPWKWQVLAKNVFLFPASIVSTRPVSVIPHSRISRFFTIFEKRFCKVYIHEKELRWTLEVELSQFLREPAKFTGPPQQIDASINTFRY